MIWLNNVKGKFFVVIVLLLLIFIPLITFILQKKSSKPLESKSLQDEQQFVTPPFYPKLLWTPADNQELKKLLSDRMVYYSSKNRDGNFSLSGKEWVATKQNISKEELYKLVSDLTNYYEDEFTKRGWIFSTKVNGFLLQPMAADGPGGGIWGYIKVENGILNAIVLQKKIPISLFGPTVRSPDPCPCDITFRMFVSNPQDLTKVLPKSP